MAVPSRLILPVIVFSQFAGTSLWFAGNAVMPDLIAGFDLQESALGHLTSAVQLGFICGTLVFAFLTIADRFSPSKVFFASALAGAAFNLSIIIGDQNIYSLFVLRFLAGSCLAGIYPVGMKIAADYYEKGLGKVLGLLVGALVLGTAFPHLMKDFTSTLNWHWVMGITSIITVLGGITILFLPDGPFRKPSHKFSPSTVFKVFRKKELRSAAFGYFGHMWELYAFWAFIPFILVQFQFQNANADLNIPLISFAVIGFGGISCMLGGYISLKVGSIRTAFTALLVSGLCCLFSPVLYSLPLLLFLAYLIIWGMSVTADSPQFSSLVAGFSDPAVKGTALTIVNSIGFAVTVISIQVINYLSPVILPEYLFLILVPGPVFGLLSMIPLLKKKQGE